MSQFKDRVQKFYSGDYDSFEDILKEEKEAILKETTSLFVEKLNSAIENVLDSKTDTVVALNEGHEHLLKLAENDDSDKMKAFVEGYERTIVLMAADCDESDLNSCKKCLTKIKENFDYSDDISSGEIADMPSTETETVVESKLTSTQQEISDALAKYGEDSNDIMLIKDIEKTINAWMNQGRVVGMPVDHMVAQYLGVEPIQGPEGFVGDEFDENVAPAAVTAGSIAIKPEALGTPVASDEEVAKGLEEDRDPIPGVDGNDVGEELDAASIEDIPEDMPNPDSFPAQHEKVVGGDKVTKGSGYEAGFEEGRKLWKKGANPKKLAQQLAETDYADKPYGYVTRFQEGLVAGFAFQEEVIRDTDPALLEEDDDDPDDKK